MSCKITGKEYQLSKIFSSDFDFYIPAYQRPYAWTEEQSSELFIDLYDFFRNEKNENYFLGSIVLIKEDDKPHSEVIDGQQRLTTLSILISVIASALNPNRRDLCKDYLKEKGNEIEGRSPIPRLHLRDKDQTFFEKYIQNINIDSLINLDPASLESESQKHIRNNCEKIKELVDDKFAENEEYLFSFIQFIISRCYIVSVSTPTQQSAFRIFSVMNSRGLDLLPTDIIKAEVIGKIPENLQKEYTDKWEEIEENATRSGFNEIFTHTRMIFAKAKQKKNLLEEFKEIVLKDIAPQILIDNIISPYADAYMILKKQNYKSTDNATEINTYLFWLNKIDNSDWMPVAIKYFANHQNNSFLIRDFITKLERLASYLHITAKNLNQRIERYGMILKEMEDDQQDSPQGLISIDLSDKEKEEFTNALNGDIYSLTGVRRNYVILRLNEFISDQAQSIDYSPNVLTIEHVLPQTVRDGSEWSLIWQDITQREYWLNKIANLVPLTRKKNSAAQNYDFKEKKEKYFSGKNGTTSFPLTTQVLTKEKWTPQVVSDRQKELINIFVENWDLKFERNTNVSSTGEMVINSFDPIFAKNYKDYEPVSFSFLNNTIVLGKHKYANLLLNIAQEFLKVKETELETLANNNYSPMQSSRIYISKSDLGMKAPIKLKEDLFIESNLSSGYTIKFIYVLLKSLGYEDSELKISLRQK